MSMGPYYKDCCKAFATFNIDQLIDDFQLRLDVKPENVVSISFTKRYFTVFDVVRDWFWGKKCIEGMCYEVVIQSKNSCVSRFVPEMSGEYLYALCETIRNKHPHILLRLHESLFPASISDTG